MIIISLHIKLKLHIQRQYRRRGHDGFKARTHLTGCIESENDYTIEH